MKKTRGLALILALCMLGTAAGCASGHSYDSLLDPKKPVMITIWHYYNGPQKTAFDGLVSEFNEGIGREKGILVESYNYGSVTALEENVLNSVNHVVGSSELPDIIASYADTAYILYQQNLLADISKYMTEKDLEAYVDSYLNEGRIGSGNGLYIFPTAKSTEIFMMNKTDWDRFAGETGASEDQLSTMEGLAETAKQYYEWTDAQTPDIEGDGKAFFGRDAMANLFIIAARQFGIELFEVKDGVMHLNVDETVMRKIWDSFYVPYVSGYFGAFGKFRSDDAKVGDLIALVGSSTSALYFPREVTIGAQTYPIEISVAQAPLFEGGQKCAVQQGAGMVVTAGEANKEYAASVFLKWFTDEQQNMEFAVSSGYLPVKSAAYDEGTLEEAIRQMDEEMDAVMMESLEVSFETVRTSSMYTNKAFEGGVSARKVLEYHMTDQANEVLAKIRERTDKGEARETVLAEYTGDAAFTAWLESFTRALQEALQ